MIRIKVEKSGVKRGVEIMTGRDEVVRKIGFVLGWGSPVIEMFFKNAGIEVAGCFTYVGEVAVLTGKLIDTGL